MYYLLSLLTGIFISVMITFNGGLTAQYGIYSATVIIHIVGLVFISGWVLSKRERPFAGRYAWFLYLGGAIGVLTTVFTNFAFGRISVSAILALGLFGQSVMGIIIDQYGLLGMPRHPLSKRKLIGLSLILCGIASMITDFHAAAVAVSFAAGVCIVISRTLNARLSELTSVHISTFFNYFVGLIVSVFVYFLLGSQENIFAFTVSPNLYIYLGGILGVAVVLLSNITVTKISAFYLTLLIFVGQVFSGILIDIIISQAFSPHNLIGGILVTIGLCVNLLLDKRTSDVHDR
ncbi:MAG: DMT family transporter [Defluviitaleaceae bacterium]|nr:DMT family transporter [Defluviitaleaceae bacterium]